MMVGRDLSTFYKKEHASERRPRPGRARGRATSPTAARVTPTARFDLHSGEVLGIAGLVGSGRTELARLIFGADARPPARSARRQAAQHRDPARRPRCRHRLPDRRPQGPRTLPRHVVRDNINMGVYRRDARAGGLLDLGRPRRRADAAFKALPIRVASPRVTVGSLSGGNQQKVLLSRLLETEPRVLILDEPTRGVDIGAKSEIYRIIDELAQQRHRHHRHLERTAGDHRHRRPRARHARRPHSSASSAAATGRPITQEAS